MKITYAMALALGLPLFHFTTALAQTTPLLSQEKEHILVAFGETGRETLSGINMRPTSKGTFVLDFSQKLDENAMLQVKNAAGKLAYQKPVKVEGNRSAWRYDLGKLQAGTYLIEVKTSDTTYWTAFRVSK